MKKNALLLAALFSCVALSGCDKFEGLYIDYDSFDASLGGSYAAHDGEHDINGMIVSTKSVMPCMYIDADYNKEDPGTNYEKTDNLIPVTQWKASVSEISIDSVKVSKITVKWITSYSWSLPLTIKFDDVKVSATTDKESLCSKVAGVANLEKKKADQDEPSFYTINEYTAVWEVNAKKAGLLLIKNGTSHAQYIESINLE